MKTVAGAQSSYDFPPLLRIAVDIGCYDNHDVESHVHVPVELESHLHIPIEVLGFESCVHTNCMLCLHKHT